MLRQHHLLIGGCTGSGKSVLLNGIIYTALHSAPSDVQLILLDPKRVELLLYRDVPHTIAYGDQAENMLTALRGAVEEMEARYARMQQQNVKESSETAIYIIIDELADLLDNCGKPALLCLKRLLQLSRAANMHVIAATQHVSRKTLPTELQINFPAVCALRCKSKIESRQLLSIPGAETLQVGTGMYYTPRFDEPVTIRIPRIPEERLESVTERWKTVAARKKMTFWERLWERLTGRGQE